jgi:pimeloyl-ACP methyl ester carboxylesterase
VFTLASNITAPTRTVEAANGVRYAYRRFGDPAAAAPPLVLLQHFRGNLDNWDPALVDALAAHREVVIFDNAGIGRSTGTTPRSITAMAHDALSFVEALRLEEVDVLGYSVGGFVAQELTLIRPQLVRRLVLAGTGPQGGAEMHGYTDATYAVAMTTEPDADTLLYLFFERSATSVAKGRDFVERIYARTEDRDADVTRAAYTAQLDALTAWGIPEPSRLERLAGIRQPVLVANGSNDIMVPTPNTHLLAEHLPDAQLEIYPDAAHGFLFQYPAEFAERVRGFLG